MNHQDISNALLEIEKKINVNEFVYGKVNLWPIFRNYISGTLIRINRSSATQAQKRKYIPFFYAFFISIKNLFSSNSTKGKSVLMVTDTIYTVSLANQDFDRVLFGIAEEFKLSKDTIEIIDNTHMNFVDLNATNYSWIESFIFSSKCLAMAMSVIVLKLCRISTFISRRLGLDTVLGISRNLDKILETTDSRTKNNKILRNTLSVFFHSFFISFLFKNSSFTNIYHANSFDPISSAINLAASRNKIDTFCCQHGGQSESNPYFCEWSLDFCIDSNIFCTTYLCWDESSSKSILGWKLNGSPPNIIITGNKWLAHTKELVFSSPSFIDSTESDLSYFNVVVTLQPSFVISDKVFEAFLNYSSKIKLWIRFHPAMNEKDQHYIHDFAKSNVRVEIEKSTEYSLSELLQVADLHLTASSSSIYEAISAGVYTVFVSENACSYFADFISQGHASYLANPEEIKEFLGSIDI